MKKIFAILIIGMFILSAGVVYAADGDIMGERGFDYGTNDDYAYSVAIDSQNNIIVTGNHGTVKYDSNGNLVWSSIFDNLSGYDVAVDSKDNIIIAETGRIMKYDPNGNILGIPIGFTASTLTVDSKDNIIAAGGPVIMKYDPNGNPIWPSAITFSASPEDIDVDSEDNIIVVGRSDYYILKLDANGNMLWDKYIDINPSNNDYGMGVAVDSKNNIVVTGYVIDPDTYYASYTIKFTPNGTEIWRIDDNIGGRWSYKVAIDSYDNIVLAGGQYDPSQSYYIWLTVKYDSNGKKIWERKHDFSLGDYDEAFDVAIDSFNNIVVAGRVYEETEGYNYYAIKYEGSRPKTLIPINLIMRIIQKNWCKNHPGAEGC
jgi:hypothetical protein